MENNVTFTVRQASYRTTEKKKKREGKKAGRKEGTEGGREEKEPFLAGTCETCIATDQSVRS